MVAVFGKINLTGKNFRSQRKKKHQNDLLDKISLHEMSYMQISFLVSELILLLEGFPFDFFFKSYWCKGDDNNEVWADAQWH